MPFECISGGVSRRSNVLNFKTRPSSDLEAATMYKLKGQSLTMGTGQGFKYRELVCPANQSSWSAQLVNPAGPFSWSV